MLETRTKVLIHSIRKLYRRSAWKNIQRILQKTHAADIAILLEELDKNERLKVFLLIKNVEEQAVTLSHLDAKIQKDLVLSLDQRQTKELVSEMESDDAADLLGALPREKSQEILDNMEKESSEEVADLMRYPEDSAGGLMSTDFLAIHQDKNVQEAIQMIQQDVDEDIISFYIYVIDEENHLVGVLSLKQLLLSKPHELIKDIMVTDLITVGLNTDEEEVARIVERYDFLSLPVLNNSQKLEGIITVDDVIDVIRAEGNEDLLAMGRASDTEDEGFLISSVFRLPWLLFSLASGAFAFFLIFQFAPFQDEKVLIYMSMIPMLLAIGATAGGQTASVTLGWMNKKSVDSSYLSHIGLEFVRSLVYALILSTSFYFALYYFLPGENISFFTKVLALHIVLSTLIASIIPFGLNKLGYNPMVGSVPLFAALSDLLAVFLLFFMPL